MLDNFDDRYLGAKASDPAVDNDGNALVVGALYFNTTDGVMKVYTASGWIAASSASVATLATFEFVATSGQTVFTGADANGATLSYVAPALIVTLNGVRLRPGDDYTATNGTSITLVSAAALNDELVVDAFGSFLVANTYTIAQTDSLLAAKSNTSTTVTKDSSTGAGTMPVGTTAQRPGTPTTGMFRMNSSTGEPEWYDTVNSRWNTFASSPNEYSIDYLVVAGGGGGGTDGGGGGGAGGYQASSLTVSKTSPYTVTIGSGGVGGATGTATTNGGNTVFGTITSIGGGRGGDNAQGTSGGTGGSGGGATRAATGAAGTTGQGNKGGDSLNTAYEGGGGGAGAAGGNGIVGGPSGNGGVGLQWLNGTFYAGGGGGGTDAAAATAPLGGNGGGGNGGSSSAFPTAGSANTGGGGGGNCSLFNSAGTRPGANGGSGIVVIRYLGATRGTGGTVTSSGGYTYHTFTSSGTFTA